MQSTNRITLPGVALVTGAGGDGIGAAIARAFASSGCAQITLTDINPATLQHTVNDVEEIIHRAGGVPVVLSVAGDISDEAFVESLFRQVTTTFGRLDYAVNCAGVAGNAQPSDVSTVADFDKTSGVNFRGLWMCEKQELRIMKEQSVAEDAGARRQRGSIVNIASQLGVVGRPDAPIYCATKSAVIGLTRCDAIDYSKFGIRVNAVCPGIVETPMTKPKEGTTPTGDLVESIKIAPMERMGTPEEIADVVVFLSSEKASFVQGAAWIVDGGYTIR